MGLITRWLSGALRAETWAPDDDRWYAPLTAGTLTEAGVRIDSESAKKISAWYRGRDILAGWVAKLPFELLERLPNDGGAWPAKSHPVYDLIATKPNLWQSSFQWRRQAMYHLIDHGNAYSRILPGARGYVDQLWPLDPTLTTPEQLPSGRLVYRVRDKATGRVETLTQDEVFHLRGASEDGVLGKGILEYARGSLGTASATESYAGRIFSSGTLNSGVISVPGLLDDEASKRMARSFVTAAGNWHLPKVLEQGAKWEGNDLTPEDAQMLLSRKYTVDDVARWLGVSRTLLENNDPSFGNAEQFWRTFLVQTLDTWLVLWESSVDDQLVLAPRKYFARFNRDDFSRGDLAAKAAADVAYVNAGILSVDEVRETNDWNARGGRAAELREPQNITGKPRVQGAAPAPPEPEESGQARAIAAAAAGRLLRKEVAEVQKLAVRHAGDEDAFVNSMMAFYVKHAALVAETLQMTEAAASDYCAGQANQIVNGDWLAALELWKTSAYAEGLAALALEGAPV